MKNFRFKTTANLAVGRCLWVFVGACRTGAGRSALL